ncbi:uncharacterized protein LOC134534397 [Bacillus rossius redtenbacheri]|uniref:uncharacterized protein LOC134534397 n=1 Tax=Bacillus rossius redtenbacheri TaxID=93214 RepID=UPI002FDE0367
MFAAFPRSPESDAVHLALGRVGPEVVALIRIPVELNGQPITALVDTVAMHTYVAVHLIPEADLVREVDIVQLATTGASTFTTGRAQVRVGVRDFVSSTSALVVHDLRDDLILGLPWLEQEDATVEVRGKRVHVGTRGRRMVYGLNYRTPPPRGEPLHLVDLRHGVPPVHVPMFDAVLGQQPQVFAAADLLRRTTITEHCIPTIPHRPPFEKPFGFGPRERLAIRDQITEMLEDGVIEPTESPYNCRIVMASKKDGSLRFCINFKPVNNITIPAPPPLINIAEALTGLGDARIFSSLDLKSGP